MKNYKTIVFDLDGTLLNTLTDLMNATNYSLRKNGYPERTRDEVRRFVGNGVRNLMIQAMPDSLCPSAEETGTPFGTIADQEAFDQAFADFKAYYAQHQLDNTAPYEGISEAIATLRASGYKMAIVSNKLDEAVKNLNDRFFGLDVAVGDQDGLPRKPNPDMVYLAMKELQADPESTVYVGDSEVDLVTAQNAGLNCISVTWGFRSVSTLKEAGATVLAADTKELLEVL